MAAKLLHPECLRVRGFQMSYRIVYECDSLPELEQLQQWLLRGPAQRRRNTDNSPIFRETDLPAVQALGSASEGMRTDALAGALQIRNASLPPTLNGWGRRAVAHGLTLDDLIERHRINEKDGRPITIYKLTATGRRILEQQLNDVTPADDVDEKTL